MLFLVPKGLLWAQFTLVLWGKARERKHSVRTVWGMFKSTAHSREKQLLPLLFQWPSCVQITVSKKVYKIAFHMASLCYFYISKCLVQRTLWETSRPCTALVLFGWKSSNRHLLILWDRQFHNRSQGPLQLPYDRRMIASLISKDIAKLFKRSLCDFRPL